MEPADMTTKILVEIRDEIRITNARLEDTRVGLEARIDETKVGLAARIDETNARLDRSERRQIETEIRLATEIIGVAGAVREVRDLLREGLGLNAKVADHERRIARIEETHGPR